MKIEPVFIAEQSAAPIDPVVWHLRDTAHALTWLQICTHWADAGRQGVPPLDPFRLWGLELGELNRLIAPLQLLPHAMSFRQPDSPGIREQIARHRPEQLRWALLCLRHHGAEHAAAWSVLQDGSAAVEALSAFLAQQWQQMTGQSLPVGPALSEGGRLQPRLPSADSQGPPDQGLLDASLWNSLIRMQSAFYRPGVQQADRLGDLSGNREGVGEELSYATGHRQAGLHREGLAL